MLSQDFVLTLLQASITCAGLVLAVYALIIPLSRRIFGYRAEALYEELQELKERVRETNIHVSTDELSELKTLLESIEERQAFPTYLSWGAGTTFFFYVVSTFMGVWWVLEWQKPIMDSWLPVVFGFSTFLLFVLFFLAKHLKKSIPTSAEFCARNIKRLQMHARMCIEYFKK